MTAPPATIVWAIGGRIDRAHIPALCRDISELLDESEASLVLCDVGNLSDPDCVALDAFARLQLTARRMGARVLLLRASNGLKELLQFSGLGDVVPYRETLLVDPRGEPEHGEQVLGVEEEREPDDSAI